MYVAINFLIYVNSLHALYCTVLFFCYLRFF